MAQRITPKLRVFVSSRMAELAPERQLVKEALDELKVDAWVFEEDAGARPESIEETFLEEIEAADLYLGIFWKGYGSYTREEYDHATELGRDRLIYEKRADLEEREPELEEFLDEVGQVEDGVTPKWFETAGELREFVREDVAAWQTRVVRQRRGSAERVAVLEQRLVESEEDREFLKDQARALAEAVTQRKQRRVQGETRMRADIGTMKNIIKLYKRWRKQNAGADLDVFATWFFQFRFSLPGFDKAQSQLQQQIAHLALPFYCKEVSADGSTSLLAILGAVSEAERFLVDPGLVMKKAVGWRHKDLWGPVIGGVGVADLSAAFENAERKLKTDLAALEREAMGLSEPVEDQDDLSAGNSSDSAVEHLAARAERLGGLDRQFAGRMLQAAWEISEKLRSIPFSDFGEKFQAASHDQVLGVYKALLGHLFFTFFLPDSEARKAMARLLTDLTDDDTSDTEAYWIELEECLDDSKGDARSIAAEIAWQRACESLDLESDPKAGAVAVLCFVAPWQAAFDELRHEFQ